MKQAPILTFCRKVEQCVNETLEAFDRHLFPKSGLRVRVVEPKVTKTMYKPSGFCHVKIKVRGLTEPQEIWMSPVQGEVEDEQGHWSASFGMSVLRKVLELYARELQSKRETLKSQLRAATDALQKAAI